MADCAWKDFLPDIIPFVSSPKADYRRPLDNMIIHYVRMAAQDFMLDSTLLRGKWCFDIACGVDEVPLVVPEDRELLHIHQLTINSDVISRCGGHDYINDELHCGDESVPVSVSGFEYDADNEALLLPFKPVGDAQNGFCATYSYTLDFARCEMPDILCSQQWRRAIRAYTLKHLFGMPSMDWSDKAYFAKYENEAAHWAGKARLFAANQGVTRRKKISQRGGDMFWT